MSKSQIDVERIESSCECLVHMRHIQREPEHIVTRFILKKYNELGYVHTRLKYDPCLDKPGWSLNGYEREILAAMDANGVDDHVKEMFRRGLEILQKTPYVWQMKDIIEDLDEVEERKLGD